MAETQNQNTPSLSNIVQEGLVTSLTLTVEDWSGKKSSEDMFWLYEELEGTQKADVSLFLDKQHTALGECDACCQVKVVSLITGTCVKCYCEDNGIETSMEVDLPQYSITSGHEKMEDVIRNIVHRFGPFNELEIVSRGNSMKKTFVFKR